MKKQVLATAMTVAMLQGPFALAGNDTVHDGGATKQVAPDTMNLGTPGNNSNCNSTGSADYLGLDYWSGGMAVGPGVGFGGYGPGSTGFGMGMGVDPSSMGLGGNEGNMSSCPPVGNDSIGRIIIQGQVVEPGTGRWSLVSYASGQSLMASVLASGDVVVGLETSLDGGFLAIGVSESAWNRASGKIEMVRFDGGKLQSAGSISMAELRALAMRVQAHSQTNGPAVQLPTLIREAAGFAAKLPAEAKVWLRVPGLRADTQEL